MSHKKKANFGYEPTTPDPDYPGDILLATATPTNPNKHVNKPPMCLDTDMLDCNGDFLQTLPGIRSLTLSAITRSNIVALHKLVCKGNNKHKIRLKQTIC